MHRVQLRDGGAQVTGEQGEAMQCNFCKGSGAAWRGGDALEPMDCPTCGGSGKHWLSPIIEGAIVLAVVALAYVALTQALPAYMYR